MALSCSCDWEPSHGDICWCPDNDFSKMPKLKRRKRCISCRIFLEAGQDVVKIDVSKYIEGDVDDHEKPLAPWYLCEHCGEIYLTLSEIGYRCINPKETFAAQRGYWKMTGFDPKKYERK